MIPRFIYLIECPWGLVKIGCSLDPHMRADTIGRGTPCPVRLIAMWPGDIGGEQQLHQRFASYRKYREWFETRDEFADFVNERRGLGLASIADWTTVDGPDAAERERDRRRRQSATLRATLNAKPAPAQPLRETA